MSQQTRLADLITSLGTDYKTIKTWIFGSLTGSLADLTTTNKTSLVAAINETKAGNSGTPPDATEATKGIAEVATQAETNTGTDDTRMVTPLKFQTRLAAYAQPLAANLTTLAGVASGAMGRSILGAADAAAAKTLLALVKADVGLSNVPNVDATARASHTGTQAASTITGLAAVATSGSASDITTGTLPTSVLPPLAINEVFTVANQAAMLALTAQRGDVAIRTDTSRSYILATDSPGTLADWKLLTAAGDVISVAGRTGAVVLTKTDVGLSNVDNTSDANKPVSTAQAAADALNLKIAQNLNDLADKATARTNLSVYSQAELGNPETDLAALYTAAKA